MPSIFDSGRKPARNNTDLQPGRYHVSKRKVRNIVTVSGRGVRGYYPSRKAPKRLKYESLIEEAVLRVLDVSTLIKTIETQPCVLNLPGSPATLRYTPDIKISVANKSSFIEVKADRSLSDQKTVLRLREIVGRMRLEGTPLILILESDVHAVGLQQELKVLLRGRPAPGRYRSDLDTSAWDPADRRRPDPETLQRWHAAQRVCNELLERVMRRDPDDLLEKIKA